MARTPYNDGAERSHYFRSSSAPLPLQLLAVPAGRRGSRSRLCAALQRRHLPTVEPAAELLRNQACQVQPGHHVHVVEGEACAAAATRWAIAVGTAECMIGGGLANALPQSLSFILICFFSNAASEAASNSSIQHLLSSYLLH